MKTAGDVLSRLFDEGFEKKATGFSKFFDSWADITAKNGIASAAAHSRIKELEKGIVLIEMDHPGWKQILQTKQSKLLNDFRIRFPEMNIVGISLILGRGKVSDEKIIKLQDSDNSFSSSVSSVPSVPSVPPCEEISDYPASELEAIKNDDLREKLIKLGQTIAEKEGGSHPH